MNTSKLKELTSWNFSSIDNNNNYLDCVICHRCDRCHHCDNITNCPLINKNKNKYILQEEDYNINNNNINPVTIGCGSLNRSPEDINGNNIGNAYATNFINMSDKVDNNYSGFINWKIQYFNNKLVFGITPGVNIFEEADNGYFLAQYVGPELELNGITLTTPVNPINPNNNISAYFFAQVNTDGDITDAFNLWLYDGIRENYQYGQLLFASNSDIIALSTFTGTITFNDGSTLTATSGGSNILGRFDESGNPIWIRRIDADSIDDIYMTLDQNNNIYFCGTFTGRLQINVPDSPTITSNLTTNMFVGRINSNGDVAWLQTATGTGNNQGEGISYSASDNTIVAIGTYSESIVFNDENRLVNQFAIFNMWVTKYDLNGNIIFVTTPFSPPNNNPVQTEFFFGGQVIVDDNGFIYITGEVFGNFIFDEDDVFQVISHCLLKKAS
jgi:hypothetical protein